MRWGTGLYFSVCFENGGCTYNVKERRKKGVPAWAWAAGGETLCLNGNLIIRECFSSILTSFFKVKLELLDWKKVVEIFVLSFYACCFCRNFIVSSWAKLFTKSPTNGALRNFRVFTFTSLRQTKQRIYQKSCLGIKPRLKVSTEPLDNYPSVFIYIYAESSHLALTTDYQKNMFFLHFFR